jgi:hypothetical protein
MIRPGYTIEVELQLGEIIGWFPLGKPRPTLSAARAALQACRKIPKYNASRMRILCGQDLLLEVNPGDPPVIPLS